MYAMPVQSSASSAAASQSIAGGVAAGHVSAAGTARTTAAASWLPAATASGATPPRRRFVRLGAIAYDIAATRHEPIAHADPPGLKSALSQPIQTTPAKPTTRPTIRAVVMRSPSHSHASVAAKSGLAELRIAESPVVIDSAADEKQKNGSAEFTRPTTAIVRQCATNVPSSPR